MKNKIEKTKQPTNKEKGKGIIDNSRLERHEASPCTPPSAEIRVSRWVDLGNLGGAVLLSAWCRCLSEPRLFPGCELYGEQLGARGRRSRGLVADLRSAAGSVCKWE